MRTWTLIGCCLALGACTKPSELPHTPKAAAPATQVPRMIALEVTADGFQPESVKVRAGQPVKLVVTRTSDETCATDLLIEGTDIKVALPLNQPVEVAWTPPKAGAVKFGCAMDMMVSGLLLVE